MEQSLPLWWQWWLIIAITINTTTNLIVFFKGRKYKDAMVHVCEWLIKRGKLIPEKCPYGNSRRKRYLVNTEPLHLHGEFFWPKKLSNGLFVETHKSIKQIQSDAEFLLQEEGFSPYIFKIVEA